MPPAATTALHAAPVLKTASARLDDEDARLRETLRRCPPAAIEAILRFRRTGDSACLPVIVRGVIGRYVGREHRAKLENAPAQLRLIEDLGVDSLTMLEIVMLAEEVLDVSFETEELRQLRTIGDVEACIARLLRSEYQVAPRAVAMAQSS